MRASIKFKRLSLYVGVTAAAFFLGGILAYIITVYRRSLKTGTRYTTKGEEIIGQREERACKIVYRGCKPSEKMQGVSIDSVVGHVLKKAGIEKELLNTREGYSLVCAELQKLFGSSDPQISHSTGKTSSPIPLEFRGTKTHIKIFVEKSGENLYIIPWIWEDIVSEYKRENREQSLRYVITKFDIKAISENLTRGREQKA